jgi:hypothetical protein
MILDKTVKILNLDTILLDLEPNSSESESPSFSKSKDLDILAKSLSKS